MPNPQMYMVKIPLHLCEIPSLLRSGFFNGTALRLPRFPPQDTTESAPIYTPRRTLCQKERGAARFTTRPRHFREYSRY